MSNVNQQAENVSRAASGSSPPAEIEKATPFILNATKEHKRVAKAAPDHARAAGEAIVAAKAEVIAAGQKWGAYADVHVYPFIPQSSSYLYERIFEHWSAAHAAGSDHKADKATRKTTRAGRSESKVESKLLIKAEQDIKNISADFASLTNPAEISSRLTDLQAAITDLLNKLVSLPKQNAA